jgi:type IV pilus assembly protein PilY1
VTSNNTVDYLGSPPNKLGWYMDLLLSGTQQNVSQPSERVISAPLLRDGRIIFITLIPSPVSNPCDYGGTGWLMELNAVKGQQLFNGQPPWDITGDSIINSQDLVAYGSTNVSPSGKKSRVGIIGTPGVVSAGTLEYKYTSGSSGQLEMTIEASGVASGRRAWRQLR